jgi:hypothetical protein
VEYYPLMHPWELPLHKSSSTTIVFNDLFPLIEPLPTSTNLLSGIVVLVDTSVDTDTDADRDADGSPNDN